MLVVLDAPTGSEVVWTDDAVVGEDNAARRHAEVCGMIRHGATHTPYQTTCRQHMHDQSTEGARREEK